MKLPIPTPRLVTPMLPYVELCICCVLTPSPNSRLLNLIHEEFSLDKDAITQAVARLIKRDWLIRQPIGRYRFNVINQYSINPKHQTTVAAAINAWERRVAPLSDWTGSPPTEPITSLTINGGTPTPATLNLLIFFLECGELTKPCGKTVGITSDVFRRFERLGWIELTKSRGASAPTYQLTDLGETRAWIALWAVRHSLKFLRDGDQET